MSSGDRWLPSVPFLTENYNHIFQKFPSDSIHLAFVCSFQRKINRSDSICSLFSSSVARNKWETNEGFHTSSPAKQRPLSAKSDKWRFCHKKTTKTSLTFWKWKLRAERVHKVMILTSQTPQIRLSSIRLTAASCLDNNREETSAPTSFAHGG